MAQMLVSYGSNVSFICLKCKFHMVQMNQIKKKESKLTFADLVWVTCLMAY